MKRTLVAYLALALFAFGLRLMVAAPSSADQMRLEGDSLEYFTLARHIRFDRVFSYGSLHRWGAAPLPSPDATTLHATSDRAPLYPALIALLWTGSSETAPIAAVLVVQAVIGTITVLVAVGVAESVMAGAGVWAGLLVAVWPLAVRSDVALLSETLYTALMMGGIRQWQRERPMVTGVLFGFATLTRLALLPLLLVLPVLSLFTILRRRRLLLITLAACVTIAPWTARNIYVVKRFVPVATAGSGANVLLGAVYIPPFSGGNLWKTYTNDPEVSAILALPDEDFVTESRMRAAGIRRISSSPLEWVLNRVLQYPRFLLDPGGDYWPSGGAIAIVIRIVVLGSSIGLLAMALVGTYQLRSVWSQSAVFPVLLVTLYLLTVHFPLLSERRHGAPLIPLYACLATCGMISMRTRRNIQQEMAVGR